MTITELKAHIEGWAKSIVTTADSDWHHAVTHFVTYVEGKTAEADAVALLSSKGWTCTPPSNG